MKVIILILSILSALVDKTKIILKMAVVILPIITAVFYIILNFIQLTPPSPLTKKYKHFLSQILIDIHFPQGWNLFAPSPVYTSVKLLMRCKNDITWSNWFDPIEKITKRHQESRFTTSGILMRQYKYIGNRMHQYIVENRAVKCKNPKSIECKGTQLKISDSEEKKILLRFTEKHCRAKVEILKEYQYQLVEIHPNPYSKKGSFKDFYKIDIILRGNHEFN